MNLSLCCRLGYKVALIDADVGLRNLDLLLGLENRVLYTAIDILEGDCRCASSSTTAEQHQNAAAALHGQLCMCLPRTKTSNASTCAPAITAWRKLLQHADALACLERAGWIKL